MSPSKFQENAVILENSNYRGDYFLITFSAPKISPHVLPGQFVHLQLPHSPELLLRRPFSIYNTNAEAGTLSLIYKAIGAGTGALSILPRDTVVNLLGPLGQRFPQATKDQRIIIAAGGYGCASTYLVAKTAESTGLCLLGARNKSDILVEDEFQKTGFEVQVSTDDGSYGHKGRITELLIPALDAGNGDTVVYACGPNAMLAAVGRLCMERDTIAYLSYDMEMCCGVGACFTCVIKRKCDSPDGWEYVRTCKYGPVFDAREIYWESDKSN